MSNNFFNGAWQFATGIWTKDITIGNYKEVIKNTQSYCWLFLVSIILSVLAYVFFENLSGRWQILSYVALFWMFLSFIPLIFGFIVLLSKLDKIPLTTKTFDCNHIHKCKEAIKDTIIEKDYAHTKKYTKFSLLKLLQKWDDYNIFIGNFQSVTNINKSQIYQINADGKSSIGGRFHCVIANPNYYSGDEKKTKTLIKYFFSNYDVARNNQYIRIFSLPTMNGTNILSNIENKNFLFYVISNVFSEIDTYVLVVDNNIDKEYEFFKTIDYVIGDIFDNGLKKTKLYFSYAIDDAHRNDILSTTDDVLINLMQNDFNERIQIYHNAGSTDICLKIKSKRNEDYTEFLKLLNISKDVEKELLSEYKDFLSDGKITKGVDNEMLKNASQTLQSWINEINT